MKTITVTFISPGESSRQQCAELILQNRDLELVAMPAGLTQQGVWQALSLTDVAVIDEAAIRSEGFEAVSMLLASHPHINCLIVMYERHDATMVWALSQGVRGILLQDDFETLLPRAIRHIHAGEIWITRGLAGSLRDALFRYPVGGDRNAGGTPARGWTRWH